MADPVVPDVPGVPPLIRLGPSPAPPELLTGDTFNAVGAATRGRWGLFQNGSQVIYADSVISFEFKQDYDLLDYPTEDGAFETYNKVTVPFEVKIRFASGGNEVHRAELIGIGQQIAASLETFDAITPEAQYLNVNVEHIDYRRANDNGVGIIILDMHLRQIRIAAQPGFTNTQDPSGADPNNDGAVQAEPPSLTQTDTINRLFSDPKYVFNGPPPQALSQGEVSSIYQQMNGVPGF